MADQPPDLSALSDAQQLALQQFTSLTDQDLATAIPLLRRSQWNVQIAITRFFDGDADTVDPVAEAEAALPSSLSNSRRAETLIDGIPHRPLRSTGLEPVARVVPTPENQMTQSLPFPLSLLILPFNFTYTIVHHIFGTVGYLFPFLPRLLARFWSGRVSQPSRDARRRPLSPRDTATRFIREFEEEYGVAHGVLPFIEGGYAQAFDMAKKNLNYLLVVLLSPEHDDNPVFVRETLLSAEFIAFVKNPSNNVILWAGTVQDAETYQVSSALNVTRFPFVCMIVHTPSVSSTAMSKLAASTGPVTARDLIANVQTAMQSQNAELERVRAQRREQQATRNLRQEQESAYERSLAQDREKARRRRDQEAAKEKAEREEREREERKADHVRKLARWRKWRAQSIPDEPVAATQDVVRISIRMPSGERVVRKFRPEAEVEELYAYVECYEFVGEVREKGMEKPEGFEHEYQFQLVSPMPREIYDVAQGGRIRDRIGRSGNLIVERIVGEDDEADEDDEDQDDDGDVNKSAEEHLHG